MAAHPTPKRTFYFIRHGETQFNQEHRFQGSVDVPLNANGLRQAEQAARILSDQFFHRIVASPAGRVLATVDRITQNSNKPVHVDEDLMEFNVGSFEGRRIEHTMKQHGLKSHASLLSVMPEDAENWLEFAPRVCTAVTRWTELYAHETLLIASHGLVFRALTETLMGKPLISDNAVPFRFEFNEHGWELTQVD